MVLATTYSRSILWDVAGFWLVVVMGVVTIVGGWAYLRRDAAGRREMSVEVFLLGVCAFVMFHVSILLDIPLLLEAREALGEKMTRRDYATAVGPLLRRSSAGCAAIAWAILVAAVTRGVPRSRPSLGWLVLTLLACGLGFLSSIPMAERGPAVPVRLAPATPEAIDGYEMEYFARGAYLNWTDLSPWAFRLDLFLGPALPALVLAACGVLFRSLRTPGARAVADRRETLIALGLFAASVAFVRLTWLATERCHAILLHGNRLQNSNTELLLDWLRAAWFPILAALFGLGVAAFAGFRLRPVGPPPAVGTASG